MIEDESHQSSDRMYVDCFVQKIVTRMMAQRTPANPLHLSDHWQVDSNLLLVT